MIKPIFNHVLIEIIDDFDGVIGSDKVENVQKGILRDFDIIADHLTASAGYSIRDVELYNTILRDLVNNVVYWQEYADSGSKFKIDSKEYIIIPFYRLMATEEK